MKYTIMFNEKQEKRLQELADKMGMSKADAVRYAITLLSKIVRETESGNRVVQIADPEGKQPPKELLMPTDG